MTEGPGAVSSGYSTVGVRPDGTITVTGFRERKGYEGAAKGSLLAVRALPGQTMAEDKIRDFPGPRLVSD